MTKVGMSWERDITTFFFIIQDFDNNNVSDCIGFEVTAITIIETTESYVNILLGDYKEPEVNSTFAN